MTNETFQVRYTEDEPLRPAGRRWVVSLSTASVVEAEQAFNLARVIPHRDVLGLQILRGHRIMASAERNRAGEFLGLESFELDRLRSGRVK